jgi:hypothetical protein
MYVAIIDTILANQFNTMIPRFTKRKNRKERSDQVHVFIPNELLGTLQESTGNTLPNYILAYENKTQNQNQKKPLKLSPILFIQITTAKTPKLVVATILTRNTLLHPTSQRISLVLGIADQAEDVQD